MITCSIPKAPQNGKIVSVSVIAKASNSRRKRRDSPPEEGISNSADNNDEVISNNNNNNNGSIPTEVPYSHLVSFACNTGFALKGSSSIQCQDDGTFNDSVPGCDGKYKNNKPWLPFQHFKGGRGGGYSLFLGVATRF